MKYRAKNIVILFASLIAASAFAWVSGEDPTASSFPIVNRNSDIGYTLDFNWSETLMTVPGRGGLDAA